MLSQKPLVSIGLPVYNGELFLSSALDSLLAQSYKNIEIIISDNKSTDTTKKIILTYHHKDKRIKYYAQKSNTGALKNFNFVLNKAKGKYFFWAAMDDFWDKNFIKLLLKPMLLDNNIVISTSDYILYSSNNKKIYRLSIPNKLNSYQGMLLFLNHPYLISVFMYSIFKTDSIRKFGIHVDRRPIFEGSSDTMTITNILLQGSLAYTAKILFSKQDTGNYLNAFDVLKKGHISKEFFGKVKRFLLFPFMFVFDMYYSTKRTSKSDLKFKYKLLLILEIIKKMIMQFIQYFWFIIKGSIIYLASLV
jgi:glycosyltransferase involved in cell wall biosynthesis